MVQKLIYNNDSIMYNEIHPKNQWTIAFVKLRLPRIQNVCTNIATD